MNVRVICDDPKSCCHGVVGELIYGEFVYYDTPCRNGHTCGYLEWPPEKHYEVMKEAR